MIYKLASRNNVDPERFEIWPAVLSGQFTRFDNKIEEPLFYHENDILVWLENRLRAKTIDRQTNKQEFRNGDPNRLYSVYVCEHADPRHAEPRHANDQMAHDRFAYSLRFKKPNESYTTYANERGDRINSSFKKIHIVAPNNDDLEYSSDLRAIANEYYEGIYPFDPIDMTPEYTAYVSSNHRITREHADQYTYVCAESGNLAWLDSFLKKLDLVERYLVFFCKGGNIYVNARYDQEHRLLQQQVLDLLDRHLPDDIQMRNLVTAPLLWNGNIYQIRYADSFVTWHKDYATIIKNLNLIPSKQFSDLIMRFSLEDFFRQIHSKDNLATMIRNITKIYGPVDKTIGQPAMLSKPHGQSHGQPHGQSHGQQHGQQHGQSYGRPAPRFHKVTRSFD